jgi:hypothetical protein
MEWILRDFKWMDEEDMTIEWLGGFYCLEEETLLNNIVFDQLIKASSLFTFHCLSLLPPAKKKLLTIGKQPIILRK